jgi:hypothetical protein
MKDDLDDLPLVKVSKQTYRRDICISLFAFTLSCLGSSFLLIAGSSPGFQGILPGNGDTYYGAAYTGRTDAEAAMSSFVYFGLIFSGIGMIIGLYSWRVWVSKIAIALPLIIWCWLWVHNWHYDG